MAPSLKRDMQLFRPQLLERKSRLQSSAQCLSPADLDHLISEIDAALERIEAGSFGICESCHDTIDADRLAHNPLIRFCLDHLNQAELEAHQQDLDLAMRIQSKLLPPKGFASGQWDTHYRYEPVGAVGGDYCELIALPDGQSLFFAVGDVSGKGVAASLLMTHLSAIFRSLLSLDLPIAEVVSRANRLFCEGTVEAQYATLVCGRTTAGGVELCNAGHCTPLLLKKETTERFEATGLPLGLFCGGHYTVKHVALEPGDSIVLYSDGITEAQNTEGGEYGEARLIHSLRQHFDGDPATMATGVLRDVACFRDTRPPHDDMTLLIIRRSC
jgi:sigma-B regulation protein RsbU (phosphoserine phosphatase)